MIDIFIPGEPKAQPRPRAFARKINDRWQARAYDAGTAEGWKCAIARELKPFLPANPIRGPLHLILTFFLPRPQALRRKKDPDTAIVHSKKPDIDNLVKAVVDACTQIGLWHDDSQICRITAGKFYTAKVAAPGMQFRLEDWKQ